MSDAQTDAARVKQLTVDVLEAGYKLRDAIGKAGDGYKGMYPDVDHIEQRLNVILSLVAWKIERIKPAKPAVKLTPGEAKALKKMMVTGMAPAGVGPTRRLQRQLVAKGLGRWMSNKNTAATCKDEDADWLLVNVPEAQRALQ